MKTILFAFLIFGMGSKCARKNKMVKNEALPMVPVTLTDTMQPLPFCIADMIAKLKAEPVKNPPAKIYRYTLNNKTVYYMQGECCDNFSDLYNDSCKIIAHPDGGFTGKGDGTMPNFHDDKKNETLIWEDKRKQ